MTGTRRFAFLLSLMFWQGGMMFYGGVTVPVIRAKLQTKSDEPKRSLITQRVTQWLNLAGTCALLVMSADLVAVVPKRRWRFALWLMATALQLALVLLHRHLSAMMAEPGFFDSDMAGFSGWHSLYLIISTAQWAAMLGLLGVSLAAWRKEDRAAERTGNEARITP